MSLTATEGNTVQDHDVIVIGGGPGGATVSTLLAKRGHRVVTLERECFPRYSIGESLLPATIHGIGSMLGVTDKLNKAGFVPKRGGTFRWGNRREPWTFEFAISNRMAGPTSNAFQVERSRFDQILLDNAKDCGVEVWEQTEVKDLIVKDGRTVGVTAVRDGQATTFRARYVVDASGSSSKWPRSMGLTRVPSEYFRNLAVFGYFKGAGRLSEPNAGNIFCAAFEHGWFWFIPLSDELTSVGAVIASSQSELIASGRREALETLIGQCPEIQYLVSDAEWETREPYDVIRVRRDWSYTSTAFSAPGFVAIGDAACFVDPVFSSGVHLATYGGLLAARSLSAVLEGRIPEDTAFREFELRYREEYQRFHDFLVGFYDVEQAEDSYFWHARRVTKAETSDAQAFVELVGGVSGTEWGDGVGAGAAASAELQSHIDAASHDPRHVVGARSGPVVGKVMARGAELQERAVIGRAKEAGFGLVPTPDGLSWQPAPAVASPDLARA